MVPKAGLCGISVLGCLLIGCSGPGGGVGGWAGSVDTLSDGRIVVENGRDGLWGDSAAWHVVEDLRIGSVDSAGPENFGLIVSLAVDDQGRFWILDQFAAEVRVFDRSGVYVRTVGRKGQGPGEFTQPARIDVGPRGRMWVMDPQNNRLSLFDSAGTYTEGLPVPGGFMIMPWPGGFDGDGDYFAPVVTLKPQFQIALGRFDLALHPLDTIQLPKDPGDRGMFTIVSDGETRVAAGIPFQGELVWRIGEHGDLWALVTDQYRLFELSPEGDTLRTIRREDEMVPVGEEERTAALNDLDWFVEQGGKVDLSRIPDSKPPVTSFFLDEDGGIWVARDEGLRPSDQVFDVFNPVGQYLGRVTVPFRLQSSPTPFIRDGMLFGVARDELDIQYVVRGRIEGRTRVGTKD